MTVTASLLIDAAGRGAPLARRCGARLRRLDRLICGWVQGSVTTGGPGAGFTYVEATEDGWWYTAPLPQGRRVLAFHTDTDLPAVRIARDRATLLQQAAAHPQLSAILRESGFTPDDRAALTAAHGGWLDPCAGVEIAPSLNGSVRGADGTSDAVGLCDAKGLNVTGAPWLAAGDAAVSFDPLSSQGLLNALFTGLAAAEAADRCLSTGAAKVVLSEYRATIAGIRDAYAAHLTHAYAAETRWPTAPFWRRRQRPPPV